jgi:mannosyl-oligosaccharide alpha-1,2-mannosidase
MTEADIRSRKIQRGGGALYYGAHMPQSGDSPHIQSHVFFGFLGDMRLIQVAPETAEDAKKILLCEAPELFSIGGLPASSIVVQVQFQDKESSDPQNLADGSQFLKEGTNSVKFSPWTEKPKHPWFVSQVAEDTISEPVSPLPTMPPSELKKTWPVTWTRKFSEDILMESQRRSDAWAEDVRSAMVHTWRGYAAKAWGHDDLKPVSGRPKDWCRLGIFILDALTTLWLMDLKDEFKQAKEWLSSNPLPSPGSHGMHSVFEMAIRGLGGLLGAHALSGEQIFLDNARGVADALLKAFDTPSGMAKAQVDVGTGQSKWHSWVRFAILAEVATVQVEMRYLTHVGGDDKYKKAADKAFDAVLKASGDRGIIPIYLTTNDEVPRFGNTKISFGAMGDSYYEYLLKQWVQNGKKEDRLKDKWKLAIGEMMDKLVRKTHGGLTYICEQDNGNLRHRMDHLACFVGGMLIMGARELPAHEVDPRWEPTAHEITRTCHEMYVRSPSGLSPEYVVFHPEADTPNDMTTPGDAPHNLLRPEAAEAMYYMHYYTGDPMYREWANEMFQAFHKYAQVKYGYAAIRDVRQKPPAQRDDMESFWAAETLKYLYLIQVPRNKLDLDQYVFNTEAHPLRIWQGGGA